MTMAQQPAQISLLGGGHPDRGETILGEQRQQQSCIPPIMFLLPRLRFADLLGMTDSAFAFINSRNHCIEPVASIPTRTVGIKLPDGLALMFEGLVFQFARVSIQHRDRLLSSV